MLLAERCDASSIQFSPMHNLYPKPLSSRASTLNYVEVYLALKEKRC